MKRNRKNRKSIINSLSAQNRNTASGNAQIQTGQVAENQENTGVTYAEAKKAVEAMNLINGFLFDSSIEDEEDAKIVIGAILTTVFNRRINEIKVTSQKNFQAIDTKYHGIRLDAHVTEDVDGAVSATIYDVEMEDRIADKPNLPKRIRYYNSLIDSRYLDSGKGYDGLPDFVSITILSYDPFGAGDLYYEASTVLTTHPDIEYEDGVFHIYLFCNGKINRDLNEAHGKKLHEVLKYIVSGEKITSENKEVNDLEEVVTKIKKRPEVTTKFMLQCDRERVLVADAKRETRKEDALKMIRFGRENEISDDKTRQQLGTEFEFTPSEIDELFKQVDADTLTAAK